MKKSIAMGCSVALGLVSLFSVVSAKAQTPDDDKQFLATAAQADVNEIKLSQLAEDKATNPAVKMFAKKMVADHMMLEAKMKPFADEWGVQAPGDMDQDHKDEYAKLSGLSGKDFDKEYVSAMKADHTKAYSLFTDEVKNTKNLKFKAAVIKGKSVVASHKNMAYDLGKKL